MKKVFTLIAVAVVAAFACSCSKEDKVATKLVFSPESITINVGDMKRVDFNIDGTSVPSGRTEFNVIFLTDPAKMEMVEVTPGVGYIYVTGKKSGTLQIMGQITGDSRDEGITGILDVTIR